MPNGYQKPGAACKAQDFDGQIYILSDIYDDNDQNIYYSVIN